MAGEIEEPFRLNFQADLLHSGSISFGRFESESLSWERRSIFSHNRYLEEVEKYSKPGSVTEKKAYFEAHFRRKALQKQSSSEFQDGGEFPTSKSDDPHDSEQSDNDNDNLQFSYLRENPCSSDPLEHNKETKLQQYENKDVVCFDESSSGYGEDTLNQESERQNCESFSVGPQDEPDIKMVDFPARVPEHVKHEETYQSETENLAVKNTEESTGLTFIDQGVMANVTSEANDLSLTCHTAEKEDDSVCSGPHRMFSPKVRPASEKKLTRPKSRTQANVDRFPRNVSNEASKGTIKPRLYESEGLPLKKTEKWSPRPASPFIHSGVKTSKAEDAITSLSKEKMLHPKKSIVKDLRSEKAVEKSLPGVRPTANRPKQAIISSKAHIGQSATGFNFKTDQRAENRKEFYMKIAEKMHAKEVEINQVHAKTKEKQAAEMNQFRKSLNFKATPMPSFYNESACGSDRHKVAPAIKTPNRPRTPSHQTTTRHDKRTFNPSVPSLTRPSSSPSLTNKTRSSEPIRRNHIPEKKKDAILKKQKEPEPKARDMSKKATKGVGIHMYHQ